MAKPIFILSLPRSGSTLLQRLLLDYGNCATLGEFSLLLRFLGDGPASTRKATYWEFLVDLAKDDMRAQWPGFDDAYYSGVRDLMLRIYSGLSNGKEWFIDKTPRYSLIADEIIKVFPDAKFIVLWRHPLAIASSMTAQKGYWYPDEFSIDMYEGLARLGAFTEKYKNKICEIRYEDLIDYPERELERLSLYLEWKDLGKVLERNLGKAAGGSLGDRTGVKKYKSLSSGSKNSWIESYNNWYRRYWAHRYCSNWKVSHVMQRYDYKYPEQLDILPVGFFSGLKDSLLSIKRTVRRHRNPVWLKRFQKKYRKINGYEVSFR